MTAMVKFGQGSLHSSVTAINDEHLGLDTRDHFQCAGNLADFLYFIVEDIGIVRTIGPHLRQQRFIAGRVWIGKERD